MQTTVDSVFRPDADLTSKPTDLVLTSSDRVNFHVHRDRVVTASTNCLNFLLLLPADGPVVLGEESSLLSLILRLIYGMSLHPRPPASAIPDALSTLRKYGLPVKQYFGPQSQLLKVTSFHLAAESTDYALDIYILASQNDLLDVAQTASTRLLSLYLPFADTTKMNKIDVSYLNKLYLLHVERLQEFHKILNKPLPTHPHTATCGAEGWGQFHVNWVSKISELALAHPTPDAAPAFIRTTLSELGTALVCEDCKTILSTHVNHIVNEWENTKNTI